MEREPISRIPELISLWKTARCLLEKKLVGPVTNGRLCLIAGNRFIEVESAWDSDSLESIAIRSWQLPRTNDCAILNMEAELFVRNPGMEDLEGHSLESQFAQGELSLEWVSAVERVCKKA